MGPSFPSPPLPLPPFSLLFPSPVPPPCREAVPQIQLGGLGERCKLPTAGSGAEPQPKSNLVHFSLKIRHLVATILMIFLRDCLNFFCGSGAPVARGPRFIEPPEPPVPTPLRKISHISIPERFFSVMTREGPSLEPGEIACIDLHQTGSVREGSDRLQLIIFWPSCAPGKEVCGGAKFLAPPYYSQRAVLASLRALFSFLLKWPIFVGYRSGTIDRGK